MKTPLRLRRESQKLTQIELAQKSGITERNYQRIEQGEQEPGVRTAIRIADALNILDLRELFAPVPDDPQTLKDIVPDYGQK